VIYVHYPARVAGPAEQGSTSAAALARWRVPAALVVLAAVVRALRWAQTAVMMNDGPEFLRLAQELAAGDWRTALSHPYHPLYPLAIAAVHPLFGDWERAGVAVSIAGGALAVGALFALLAEAFDRRLALVGAFLLAVHPSALELSDVQSDALYLGLFLAAAACLYRAIARSESRVAFIAGLTAGVAYLARPEGLGLVVVGVLLSSVELLRRHWRLSQALRVAAPLALGGALAIAPYVGYLSARAGGLVLTGKKSVTGVLGVAAVEAWLTTGSVEYRAPKPLDPLLAAHPELTPPPRGARPFRDKPAPKGVSKYPAAAALLLAELPKALRPEIVLLLAIGLFAARGRLSARGRFFTVAVGLYLFVLFGLAANSGYVARRHVLPPVVLLFGYAALGVVTLADALARVTRLDARLRLALPLVAVAALGLGKSLRPDRVNALPERRAAEWVRAEAAPGSDEAVAAVKQRVGYYAGARFVDLRRAPHPALFLAYLRRERARFVVVDGKERAELESLTATEPGALTLVHEEHVGKDAAYVFELH
jgi:hypothetical protein